MLVHSLGMLGALALTKPCGPRSGIVGPHVFSTIFCPRYRASYTINLSILVVSICAILTSWLLVIRKDCRRAEPTK